MKSIKKSAQSLIEYGLILALVAVTAVAVLGKLGATVGKTGDNANSAVSTASTNAMNTMCAGQTKADGTKYTSWNDTAKACQ